MTKILSSPTPSSLCPKVNFTRRIWHRMPLNWRMVTVIICLLAGGLGLTGVSLIGILQSHLLAQVDKDLNEVADQIRNPCSQTAAAYTRSNITTSYHFWVKCPGLEGKYEQDSQKIGDDEETLLRPEQQPTKEVLNRLEEVSKTISIPMTVLSANNKTAWRVISRPGTIPESSLTIGIPLTKTQETIHNTQIYVAVSSLLIIFLGAIIAYYLVTWSLLPVRQIKEVAGRIAAGDLHQRIRTKEAPSTEVGSLTVSLNQMLSRIDQAFQTQKRSEEKVRQFVSDASHELRTPLAAIRGYGELYRIGGVPADRVSEVMGRIESEASRMGELVEDLLKLARLDEGRQVQMAPMNLTEVVSAAVLDLTALSPGRQVQLIDLVGNQVDRKEELWIEADRNLISQILTNLVGNVERYAGSDTPAEIAFGLQLPIAGTEQTIPLSALPQLTSEQIKQLVVVIEVRDHGPGIPEGARDRIFERFYRHDTSRSRQTGGTGLGLSIVAAVAKLHGGQAQALETPGGGLTMRISFPYQPTSDQVNAPTGMQPRK